MDEQQTEHTFTLYVTQDALEELQEKLEASRLPDELQGADWDYGVPLVDVQRLLTRWRKGFDWRAVERAINKLPMFVRMIEVEDYGLHEIQYIHHRSSVAGAVPLLFVHGWPGSFLEVEKILPLLVEPTEPEAPAFHVVSPSLPGFGFSEAPRQKGFGHAQFAEVSHKLMLALGYSGYVVQGGDLGARVARVLAQTYGPAYVKAWHTNMPSPSGPPRLSSHPALYFRHLLTPYSSSERAGLARAKWFQTTQRGYYIEQATKPQTLGYLLADSPAGLLAWIYEKLVLWSDNYKWSDDEVLTWVSVYWFSSAGPAASLRIYFERRVASRALDSMPNPTIPLGLSYFPKEIHPYPKTWCRTLGKVVFESEHEGGGHFAAHERPEKLAGDLRRMFGKKGPAFGVVEGHSGY
ncbi:Alpha/Beta hydrolase protein [Vararia minispora EC-137]|uniref:Alpha/Beta hydrolase protein n=1 Tax=Vararia minispora EC-137 TaxID=1314806 RepID=A0ACB8Q861_9AGAM|nr:Alpha/Beta hydrolase protein [Vararia minispora EC-137]